MDPLDPSCLMDMSNGHTVNLTSNGHLLTWCPSVKFKNCPMQCSMDPMDVHWIHLSGSNGHNHHVLVDGHQSGIFVQWIHCVYWIHCFWWTPLDPLHIESIATIVSNGSILQVSNRSIVSNGQTGSIRSNGKNVQWIQWTRPMVFNEHNGSNGSIEQKYHIGVHCPSTKPCLVIVSIGSTQMDPLDLLNSIGHFYR